MGLTHFSMWPLMSGAACGEQDVETVGELPLVECDRCRVIVARAEILGRRLGAA